MCTDICMYVLPHRVEGGMWDRGVRVGKVGQGSENRESGMRE